MAVACAGILLGMPLMLVIALAVRCTSRGRVIYVQPRVGLDRRAGPARGATVCRRRHDCGGRIFRIYKFRTMVDERATGQIWARRGDPRVTRVGAVLRRSRLDELPQFVNVLRGEMNVVGPRPEQPAIFQRLKGEIVEYGNRQRVLPGITGWAQINHAYDRSLDDVRRKVALDLEYLQRRSAREDLRIMARTLPVMLTARGAL